MGASTPYDSTAFADVVLRSSDNVHFFVLKSLLSLVSLCFRDMFSISQDSTISGNETKCGYPVIPLEEDSTTLCFVLDLFYPRIKERQLDDLPLIWKAAKAIQKYLMDIVEGKLKDRLIASGLISSQPLRVYAISIDLGWEDAALEAARRTLHTPLECIAFIEELRSISGTGFYRFLEYRLRCERSPDSRVEKLIELPRSDTSNSPEVSSTDSSSRENTTDMPTTSPFQSSAKSDLIFRSSDSVDFFVTEAFIHLVSPDFDSVFPLQTREVKGGLPLIHLATDSEALRQLLSIIYHYVDASEIRDFELFMKVAEAAHQYKMPAIEKKLQIHALTSPVIVNESLQAYILASLLRWEDVAKSAALNTLSKPLREMPYVMGFNRITGEDLYRLVAFRFKCADAARKSFDANQQFLSYGPSCWQASWVTRNRYNTQTRSDYRSMPLEEVFKIVKECPRGSTIDKIYVAELDKLGKFIGLKYIENPSTFCGSMKSWNNTSNLIEEVVSKVPLEMDCSKYNPEPVEQFYGAFEGLF